jgi:glyoxylase-like metal-dependent hydrolase (beta-lactamase superfamily II)/rhodanese-related sulfurtransferase
MTGHIDADTLRAWLERKRPVTLIDVRSGEDRAQWSIPGSIHIDVYEALKAGQRSVLSEVDLPRNLQVVTVCNLGKMSERAAQELTARGIQAVSLQGGMKAWSLAWNQAAVDLPGVRLHQVRRTGKGCLSYMALSGSEAVVIDASLPPEVYMDLALQEGARIRCTLDTHIHADHLSRSRLLAQKAGAELLLPRQNRVRFSYSPIDHGKQILFGRAAVTAIRTPGHTPESTCYLLDGRALFTGDTLFLAGVGRPDLHANAGESRARAALLYRSLKQLLALGPEVRVFPGHMSEPAPFDGKPIEERLGVIADRLQEWLSSEHMFVAKLLDRLPASPPNYTRITGLNEAGELPDGDVTDLEAGANRCAVS